VYQGTVRKGDQVYNMAADKMQKVPRLVKMHANEMEEVAEARAGEICAMFGVECNSGTTFTDGNVKYTMVRRTGSETFSYS
jgi:elongation factor G